MDDFKYLPVDYANAVVGIIWSRFQDIKGQELKAYVELDTSRDGFSSVIPSESHESAAVMASDEQRVSKSLRCKAKNINQI